MSFFSGAGNVLKQVGVLQPGVHTLLPAQDTALLSAADLEERGDLSSVRSFLCIDRVKVFTDGSLGAETAALLVSARGAHTIHLQWFCLSRFNITCLGIWYNK